MEEAIPFPSKVSEMFKIVTLNFRKSGNFKLDIVTTLVKMCTMDSHAQEESTRGEEDTRDE